MQGCLKDSGKWRDLYRSQTEQAGYSSADSLERIWVSCFRVVPALVEERG